MPSRPPRSNRPRVADAGRRRLARGLAAALAPAAARAAEPRRYRILHVMSYHSPWRWTDRQFEGFQESMAGVDVSYEVFQMDTKRQSGLEQIERKARQARALIDSFAPDLVYTTDDDAQEHVVRHYVGASIPFVFSGVNNDPATYGFAGSPNVTGVIEQEHFVESIALLRRIVPGAARIALVFDDAKMWAPVRARIAAALARVPGASIVANDTILTFADYKRRMQEYPRIADAVGTIGIFSLKDEGGRNVPYQAVQRWTAENSRLPDFSFWIDRVHFGTLCAVTVSEREQGRAAGRLARAILTRGRSPSEFPMVPTTRGAPVASLARARALGLRLDADLLLSTEIVPRYEWDLP